MEKSINVLALVKYSERYIFLYDNNSIRELFNTLERYAKDKELNFTYYDAVILTQKIRKLEKERQEEIERERKKENFRIIHRNLLEFL